MLIEKKKKGNVTIYIVDKDYDDSKLPNVLGKKLSRDKIKTIIDHDADVYTKEGKLLIRFRKHKLKKENIEEFYSNVIKFATQTTSNRGSASASKKKNLNENPKTMTNILGYFDTLAPSQKLLLKRQGKKISITTRETRFNMDYPEKFKKLLPLIKEIDKYYEEYVPENYNNPLNVNLNYSIIQKIRLKDGGFGFVGNVLYRNSNSITYSNRKDYQSETDYSYDYQDRVNNNTQNLSVLFNPTLITTTGKHTLKNLFNYQSENLFIQRKGNNYDNLQEIDYSNSIGFRKYLLTSQYEKVSGSNNFGVNYFWMGRYQPDYRITPLARSLGSNDSMSVVWRDTYRFWSNMNEQGLGLNYNKTNKKFNWGIQEQFKYRNFNARVFRYNDEITLSEITNNTDSYYGLSNLLSSYVLWNGKINRLNYSYGLRNENQNFLVNTSDFSGRNVNVTGNYFDFLPSINLKYLINETDDLRLSASQTVARPEFREVSNFAFYDFVRNAQVVGNSNLTKGNIINLDLRYEKFIKSEENFSTTIFFKNFTNPIEQIVANGSSPSNLILTYSNPTNAKSFGLEMEYRKKISKLITFYTNLSYIESQVKIGDRVRPLQGQSPYIINTGLFYTLNKISVSLFYNKIGERISAVGFNGYSDIYENGRDLVDATVQFKTKKVEFKLSLTDLLSQQTVFYQKLPSRNLINTINEKTISLSLNYKL